MNAGDERLRMIWVVESNISNAINSQCTEAGNNREMSASRGSNNDGQPKMTASCGHHHEKVNTHTGENNRQRLASWESHDKRMPKTTIPCGHYHR
jgi:hypothetical protein